MQRKNVKLVFVAGWNQIRSCKEIMQVNASRGMVSDQEDIEEDSSKRTSVLKCYLAKYGRNCTLRFLIRKKCYFK